jgi:hypothetical protein
MMAKITSRRGLVMGDVSLLLSLENKVATVSYSHSLGSFSKRF